MSDTLGDFLAELPQYRDLSLVFDLGHGKRVPVGYHVTEFKALDYHTVDCGGVEHRFHETVIELWRTALEPDRQYMSVGKFLSIYHKVSPKVGFVTTAPLVFLYGGPGEPAARYAVAALEAGEGALLVHLQPDTVRCKAADRRTDAVLAQLPVVSGCCGPAATVASDNALSGKLCC
jgi:Family of unknown function (DUF6428)